MILVINSGSSSIKYKLYQNNKEIYSNIEQEVKSHHDAILKIFENLICEKLISSFNCLDGVGHRVVHGGEYFSNSVLIDESVISKLIKLIPLAPLHNPANIDAIKIIASSYPSLKQVAVFDTAFHQTIPKKNYIYPIDYKFYQNNHIRRYGFHGTSHEYVAMKAAKLLNKDLKQCNLITLHLGNGASACAIKDGKSYDTSMGFTPLEGLMMGTRCGDIDPAIIFYMINNLKLNPNEIDNILNKQSGFKGICGKSNLKDILKDDTNDFNRLALDIYIEKIKKYIGSYFVQLEKVDAIVFTGGIGENSSYITEQICKSLSCIGVELDKRNDLKKDKEDTKKISSKNSKIDIFVIKTDEEFSIYSQTKSLII